MLHDVLLVLIGVNTGMAALSFIDGRFALGCYNLSAGAGTAAVWWAAGG